MSVDGFTVGYTREKYTIDADGDVELDAELAQVSKVGNQTSNVPLAPSQQRSFNRWVTKLR